jgi:hypothetical protein
MLTWNIQHRGLHRGLGEDLQFSNRSRSSQPVCDNQLFYELCIANCKPLSPRSFTMNCSGQGEMLNRGATGKQKGKVADEKTNRGSK